MTFIKKLKKEINKIIRIKGHILYNQYNNFPLLKNCNSKWLKENFKEYNNQKNFIAGIYNLTRLVSKNIIIDEFKELLQQINNSFDENYYIPNEKFYAINPNANSWGNFIISIEPADKILNLSDVISLSKLKEFEMRHPNMMAWNGVFNKGDKKTTKKLIKEKLMSKPFKYEKELFF